MDAVKKNVWLDCDPGTRVFARRFTLRTGHDDALAIILCAFSPQLRLLGISTVAGNQTVDKTTLNAARILHGNFIVILVHSNAKRVAFQPALKSCRGSLVR
jgi:inosine-uridine nucleoside N-ribohydrolase